jgi:hypothetical protein
MLVIHSAPKSKCAMTLRQAATQTAAWAKVIESARVTSCQQTKAEAALVKRKKKK